MRILFFIFIFLVQLLFINNYAQSEIVTNNRIAKRIILIGDAGDPKKGNEPVLIALKELSSEIKDSTVIIFLGDNIYPIGLTDNDHPNRKEYEGRIDEQIDAVIKSNSKAFFIPGNHDWNRGKNDGIEYVKRQYEYVLSRDNKNISFKPENGCPGPEYYDFGDNIRIIFLDTQWWLQDKNFRTSETDDCEINSEEMIIDVLSALIEDENKFIIIAAHHPLKSFGKHGGNYSLTTHLFPLTEVNRNLFLPLPVIGSVYTYIKKLGISRQDLSNPIYRNMINKIESVLKSRNGIVYASGHEHALQIIRGINDNLYLVSGAGIFDKVDDFVGIVDQTLFAENSPGFFMLDFFEDGKIRLSAVVVTGSSGSTKIKFELLSK